MKLRINGNSIRLRLSKADVDSFVSTGTITAVCNIMDKSLKYTLAHRNDSMFSAELVGSHLFVYLPSSEIDSWNIDERVGFECKVGELNILVEKDFQCLNPREKEDETDLYSNPNTK
jgi:hypothetical protein